MQLGFVSAILAEQSLDDVLRFAADEGFDCVELMCWPPGRAERRYAGVTHIDVVDFDQRAADEVHRRLAATGVRISGWCYYPNLLSADSAEAAVAGEHLRRVIRAATLLGVGVVNTFAGRDPHLSVDGQWPRFLEVWRPLVGLAEESGVRIGIENCPMLFTGDEWPGGKNLAHAPAIWRRMFETLPSPAWGLNYDPSHLVWQRIDYIRPLAEFASRIVHVHLKDVRIEPERLDDVGILATPLEYHQPRLPGRGDIDWPRFLAALAATGYQGPACIEVEDRDFEGSLAARQQALRQAADFIRRCLPSRG
jgi:sugar phosphate isomerase/epimerase